MPIYEPKNKFSIEEHFKQFVSVMYNGKSPEELPKEQLHHIKGAFFASWGQCLLCLRDDLPHSEDATVAVMMDMMVQVEQTLDKLILKG